MKKLIILLALVLSISVNSKTVETNHNIKLKNSLLWKITGKDISKPSYLYGTMHLVCDNKTFEKEKVTQAMSKTDKLYLELDGDDPLMMMELMTLASAGKKIKDIEDEKNRERFLELASKVFDMNKSVLKHSSLFNIFSMIAIKAMPECNTVQTSVEEALMKQYTKAKKEILGLETAKQQMGFIVNAEIIKVDALLQGLEQFDKMQNMYQEMVDVYSQENITSLFSQMATPNELMSKEEVDKVLTILLEQRNRNWVKKIPQIIQNQPTLFGVGAGHLGGDIGVINLLRQAGYTVEAILD